MLTGLRLWLAIGAAAAVGLFVWWAAAEHARADRVQADYDRYKLEIVRATTAEIARQKSEGEARVAVLQARLDAAASEKDAAEKAADDLQEQIDGQPVVPGRGATKADVDALNR